jgi:hypothetical protein
MKKNSFDPFMINNFSNVPRQSKFSSLSTPDMANDDLMSMTFLEKRTNMSIPKVRTGLVLLITSNSFGEINDLGKELLKNFCVSVASGFELPEYMFFINTGVKLIEDKEIVDILKKIKKYGTNVVISFESVNYFGLENNCKTFNKWAIGDITAVLVNSKNVVKI